MAIPAINHAELPNGLKVVHTQIKNSNVAYFGIAVRAGSCDETNPAEFGLAHFVEHTIFKGTAKRSSWHIINRMEAVGGELNAFTSKTDTVIYTVFPKGVLNRAVELVADLVLNSRFPQSELLKERDVVCDEINSYLDSPADAVYDDFEDALYAGSSIGHNILGTLESVKGMTSDMCREWLDRHYHAKNMVVFYAGPSGLTTFLRTAERFLSAIPVKNDHKAFINESAVKQAFGVRKHIDSHQAHTVLGCAFPSLSPEKKVCTALLSNILGGPGMNSLFNVALREKRGLVYSVESSISNWRDSSMFATYFGCDIEDNEKCIFIIKEIINDLCNGFLSPRKLSAAKKQYQGQLLVASENPENRIMSAARAKLNGREILTLEQTDLLLSRITTDTVVECASLFAGLSALTFAPDQV